MASASLSNIEEEVNCPICKEYLTVPVSVDCGHNFCRDCISQYCDTWDNLGEDPAELECPLCKAKIKKGNIRPNWQLASIVEKIKCLSLNPGKEQLCMKHKEKLQLFCKEDQELLCLFCEKSPEHRRHTVLLVSEAAQECKDNLHKCREVLRRKQERILANKVRTGKESQDLLSQIGEKRTQTMAIFNKLQKLLEEQKTVLLLELEKQEKKIVTQGEKHMARLMEDLSSLKGLLKQIEEKYQQPPHELLQDIRWTLESYEKNNMLEYPMAFPPEMTNRIRGFCDVQTILEGIMNQFPANVTLDPDTANPKLILSEDLKSVRCGNQPQPLPNNPERFDEHTFVLGREGFTRGRHFWDISVGSEESWVVGVARKSVRRKAWHLSYIVEKGQPQSDFLRRPRPEEGIWAVMKASGVYEVLDSDDTPLFLGQELKRIRVTLDCTEGLVSFSDADTGVHLYTFSGLSFNGETILPFFCVDDEAHLRISP